MSYKALRMLLQVRCMVVFAYSRGRDSLRKGTGDYLKQSNSPCRLRQLVCLLILSFFLVNL